MAELDLLASPYHFPLAGVHGAERRDIHDHTHIVSLPDALIESCRRSSLLHWLNCRARSWKPKGWPLPCTIAGHRSMKRPCLRSPPVAQAHPELALQPGKCVVELKPKGINKGAAIAAFMATPPFRGRTPVFLGMT